MTFPEKLDVPTVHARVIAWTGGRLVVYRYSVEQPKPGAG